MFSDRFLENTEISNFMKIRPVGAELFHADGRTNRRTGMAKLIVVFRNFANAPKTYLFYIRTKCVPRSEHSTPRL